MTTFLIPPCREVPQSTDAENQIRGLFFQQWEQMKHQLETTVSRIDAWRQKAIEKIHEYANEQMSILGEDYDRQRLVFDRKCEENLDITRAYWEARNEELFNELRSACLALKFQVTELEYVKFPIDTVRVITVYEQLERAKNEHSDALKPEDSKLEGKPIVETTNNIQGNPSSNINETIDAASSVPKETQPQPLETTFSNNNDHQPGTIKNDPIDKCPTCCMIFPLMMTQNERFQHINEH